MDTIFDKLEKPFDIYRRKEKKPAWVLRVGSRSEPFVVADTFVELLVKANYKVNKEEIEEIKERLDRIEEFLVLD